MKQPRKARTPDSRGAELTAKTRKRVRRKFKQPTHKGGKPRLPGEIEFKTDMALILSLAGYTQKEIGLSIGESTETVKNWLSDENTQKKYLKLSAALPEAAMTLLQTYTIEAVHAFVDIMRTESDNALVLKAAAEILDRGGLPKSSRTEADVNRNENLTVTDDGLVARLREAPVEVQEQAAQLVEGLEQILAEHASQSPAEKPEAEKREET